MEQNPNKTDKAGNLKQTAIRARNGEFIMWMMDRKPNGGFLGSIQNGKWVASQMRATQPAQYGAQAAGASHAGFSNDTVPDIPAGMTTPEYVIQTAGGGQYTMSPEEAAAADAIAQDATMGEAMMDDNFDPEAYADYDGIPDFPEGFDGEEPY